MPMTALDYEEIRQLLATYNLAIDLGDVESWVGCFVPDGEFECTGLPSNSPFAGRYQGRDELHAYASRHYSLAKGHARHWNTNIRVEGDGETATLTCYLLALNTTRPPEVRGSTGIYRDRLRKVDGQWRFERRHIAID